jgi:cytochrome c oxidase accessory protein FixG
VSNTLSKPEEPPPDEKSPLKPVDWKDYRDHLTTADKEGRRMWLFPRKPRGRLYQARTYLSFLLLTIMFAGPFVKVQGNPLLLLNFIERKFVILGHIFWPQDMFISAITLLIFLTGIIVFTAAFGRLWCGWTCPQTVLMEMVFRKIEYFIEGDSAAQRSLAKAPWSFAKIAKKMSKHGIFFALSFIIGNTLLAYLIGKEQLFRLITDSPKNHIQGLFFMVLFTFIFYAIFARFREQACTFICPYGRFQSTLLDENSIVVAYDYKRGEGRGTLRRAQSKEQRKSAALGDCIDCRACVTVCPTGIDIRNGTQMECVQCTACIDACNNVMTKINQPLGLIRYASLNGIEKGQKLRFTPRLAGYAVLLTGLIVLWTILVLTRSDVQTTLLRAPGALFQQMPDGRFSNLYTIRVLNKTSRDIPIELKLENTEGKLQVMGKRIVVPAENLAENSIIIELDPKNLKSGSTPLVVGIYSNGKRVESLKTSFIGPRNDAVSPK